MFQRLLAHVNAGKVDVIVVYKLDRFSRSLLDFLKLQEELDQRGCGVVSVTQNFIAADAMGRLILNVLMSFAQFEREMTAERIRDKVAAARRKGKMDPRGVERRSGSWTATSCLLIVRLCAGIDWVRRIDDWTNTPECPMIDGQ